MMRTMKSPKLTLILLLAVYINLMSYAGAAPPPVAEATISSSTSANGLPLPPAKTPADSFDAANNALPADSETSVNNALFVEMRPPLITANNEPLSSITATNNDIAHLQGESFAVPSEMVSSGVGGGSSKLTNGQKGSSFVDFPPFTKSTGGETRYQRQRRSYSMPSLNQEPLSAGPAYRFTRPDELELRLDDDRDREAFIKLMSIFASNNRLAGVPNDNIPPHLYTDDETQDDRNDNMDGDEDSIDLGAFQRPVANPYWTPMLGRPSEPIDLMSSLLAAEPPRTHPSSGNHGGGYYGLGDKAGLPFEIGLASRASTSRDEDDAGEGEWLEDTVPFRGSHYKTRRSGNTEFTFNPVKSHFRRYMRAVPLKSGRGLEFIPSGGRFGAIIPSMNRRRRATAGVTNNFPSVHWM